MMRSSLSILIIMIYGLSGFLYGFLSIKTAVILSSTNVVTNKNPFSKLLVNRTIFMIIDAWRADFINGPHGKQYMPYLSKLINENEACLFTAIANPPTVTMPRIKAMVSGKVPAFVDVIFNLGSPKINESNFVTNLVNTGRNAVFYGDETWLKLYPNTFLRHEVTTSFFVTDYSEVDLNVTSHLHSELKNNDWDLMILHYLGLDHIGHLVGPRSPLVEPKLIEMDTVIQEIHQNSLQDKLPQLLIICGDHGMKDSGSHGGASREETHVAVAMVGVPCKSSKDEISQVDLASTVSVLLNLPEPESSVGKLIPDMLLLLSNSQLLNASFNNMQHLAKLLTDHIPDKIEDVMEEAKILYKDYLLKFDNNVIPKILNLTKEAANALSSQLLHARNNTDVYLMITAAFIIFMAVTLMGMLFLIEYDTNISLDYLFLLLSLIFFVINSVLCGFTNSDSLMCSLQYYGVINRIFSAIILSYLFVKLFQYIPQIKFKQKVDNAVDKFLIVGTLLHTLSFGASSLIEEEHQVWYFFWTTLLILSFKHEFRLLVITNVILQKITRKWNQTGDKWASLPDVQDYLAQNVFLTSCVAIFGLLLILQYFLKVKKHNVKSKCICTLILIFIYLYKSAVGLVDLPYFHHCLSSMGYIESRIFLMLLILYLIYNLKIIKSTKEVSEVVTNTWILGITILRRPHDIILIPIQLFSAFTLGKLYKNNLMALALSHYWLGWTFYFYQGNSNSLASIDLAAGYTGLTDYNPVVVGILLLFHTYSSPILSHFLLLSDLVNKFSYSEISKALRISIFLRFLPLSFYLIIVIVQRDHLFIWSVFAPKLLYEFTSTVIFIGLFLLSHIILLCKLKN